MDIECDSPTRSYAAARPRNRVPAHAHGIAVVAGPGAGLRAVMEGEELRIGKAPSNHLCLPDPTVSRFHCVIERTTRGLLLRDLGSFNGTQVGGCWVESAYLAPDAPIQIGQSVMQMFVAERDANSPADPGPRILGASPATQRLVAMLPQIARTGATILLEGETGTGKSMVAELIHNMGPRAAGPFVVVDGGALAPTLVESELFGHERGSFTGASERRLGAFETAQGGTVFIDEIGEMPLDLQPKLLRALEERVVRRVGSAQSIRLDVQIIAATNRNLRQAVADGRFRADLYYRLEALRLTIPPLRDRREDIPQLVEHFCRRTRAEVEDARLEELKADFLKRLWPGNVRELRNAVERAVLLGAIDGDVLTPAAPRAEGATPAVADNPAVLPFRSAKEIAIARWEQSYLTRLMQDAEGNLSRAARLAQIDRGHLRDLLRHHRIAGRE